MRTLIVVLAAICFSRLAADELSYHDADPVWMFNGGNSRGTWFHLNDFIPGATEFTVQWAEIWLYSADSPVFVEIWSGGAEGPLEFLAQEEFNGSVTWFTEPVVTGPDFWCMVHSEDPVNILTDGNSDGHSFFTDDYLVWEPFDLGEFFISVGNESESLQGVSWGAIKHLF